MIDPWLFLRAKVSVFFLETPFPLVGSRRGRVDGGGLKKGCLGVWGCVVGLC